MVNTIIDKYKITRLIGEGGMASVYEAKHETLETKVAIKVLNPFLSSNSQIRERFKNEAKLMASLNHPNITKVIDFVEQPHQLSIIMELLEGEDLNQKIKKEGPLPEKVIADIFTQALSAFQYAHEKGIVHRDIKPSNIILLPDGKVKILDFGIAKLYGQGNEMTQTGTQMGTPVYMSPEQVKGDKSIDFRSDIYSLGVTLFYAVNGKSPYDVDNNSQFDIFNKIVFEELPAIKTNDRFNEIFKKACKKDRELRFQSCQEWLDAMNQTTLEHTTIAKSGDISNPGYKKNQKENDPFNVTPSVDSVAASISLVIGIIGLILSWIPFLGILIGIVAIILGINGQKDKNNNRAANKSLGIGGIVLGTITIIIGIIALLAVVFFVNDFKDDDNGGNINDSTYSVENTFLDTDNDSIPDNIDSCPEIKGNNPDGCFYHKYVTFKNRTNNKVYIAISFFNNSEWESHGWYPIDPYSSYTYHLPEKYEGNEVYWYGQKVDDDNIIEAEYLGEDRYCCVNMGDAFEIFGDNCTEKKGFYKLSLGFENTEHNLDE